MKNRIYQSRAVLIGLALLALISIVTLLAREYFPVRKAVSTEEQIQTFCSACHAFPEPALLPRTAWEEQIGRMYEVFAQQSKASKMPAPDQDIVVSYYLARAPERLEFQSTGTATLDFEKQVWSHLESQQEVTMVSHVQFLRLEDGPDTDLLVCEGRLGLVSLLSPKRSEKLRNLATIPAPARAHVTDLDQDGRRDILIANLGDYMPSDDPVGGVFWLRRDRRGGFRKLELLDGVGRVSDVAAGDFDGDGDLDIVVGEFGWRNRGGILLLENFSSTMESPDFQPRRLDTRPGTVRLLVTDLNRDGHLDFVAFIAQEFETVVGYLNSGNGTFEKKTLFDSHNPGWGSSGMELVDLDGDGDQDLLLTNGDTFDNFILKPYHGVSWLENRGNLQFEFHRIAQLPAAYCAKVGDIDGDGDQDIVACSYYDPTQSESTLKFPSLLWLEQINGSFQPRPLATGPWSHASLDVADFDGDGKAEIAVGVWPAGPPRPGEAAPEGWFWLLRHRENETRK